MARVVCVINAKYRVIQHKRHNLLEARNRISQRAGFIRQESSCLPHFHYDLIHKKYLTHISIHARNSTSKITDNIFTNRSFVCPYQLCLTAMHYYRSNKRVNKNQKIIDFMWRQENQTLIKISCIYFYRPCSKQFFIITVIMILVCERWWRNR